MTARLVAALGLLLVVPAAACGGGGGDEAACKAYGELRVALLAASADASPAKLAVVDRQLRALSDEAGNDTLEAAAAKARAGWSEFKRTSAARPRDEFSARETYFRAIAPLTAFATRCGVG